MGGNSLSFRFFVASSYTYIHSHAKFLEVGVDHVHVFNEILSGVEDECTGVYVQGF